MAAQTSSWHAPTGDVATGRVPGGWASPSSATWPACASGIEAIYGTPPKTNSPWNATAERTPAGVATRVAQCLLALAACIWNNGRTTPWVAITVSQPLTWCLLLNRRSEFGIRLREGHALRPSVLVQYSCNCGVLTLRCSTYSAGSPCWPVRPCQGRRDLPLAPPGRRAPATGKPEGCPGLTGRSCRRWPGCCPAARGTARTSPASNDRPIRATKQALQT